MSAALMPAADHPALSPHLDEARGIARRGAVALAVAVVPAALWLTLAPLSSAVIATGFVKVDLDRRPVQHAEGGIVREVKVRDGQRVAQGQPLLVLGDVGVDADVNRLQYRVLSERAGLVRLEAEQAGLRALAFPDDLRSAAQADARLAEQLQKERALFDARRDALHTQLGLLQAQREKVTQEVASLRAQIERAGEALRHQKGELERHRSLLQEGYVPANRIAELESGIADYGIKLEERRSELARAEQRLLDTALRARGLEDELRQQASDQLKVAAARLSELQQELRKATDASTRQVIVAPAAGDVLNLRFTSPGTVVPPRETVADIVPADPRLVVEAHLRTEDVANVHQGQPAQVRFTAFSHRSTPLVDARVFYVAADRTVDRQSGQPFYVALVEVDPAALRRAGDLRLQAGMPAELFVQGPQRSPLQYLLDPLTQSLARAGRER